MAEQLLKVSSFAEISALSPRREADSEEPEAGNFRSDDVVEPNYPIGEPTLADRRRRCAPSLPVSRAMHIADSRLCVDVSRSFRGAAINPGV